VKYIKNIVLFTVLSIVIVGCGTNESGSSKDDASPVEEDQIVLKLSNDSTDANAKVKAALRWAELVEEKSDGRLVIEVYDSAQLYNDEDAIQAVGMGNIDLALPPPNLLSSVDPNWGLFELPSLFGIDYDQYRQVVEGEIGEILAEGLEEKLGVKVIGHYHAGNYLIANNNKMIEKPEDLKGEKIRIIGGLINEAFIKEFGAGPTQIPWPEVYTALQQKTIDGVETTMSGANQINGWEVMDYVAYTKHKQSSYTMIMNKDSWENLPEDLQEILLETYEESRVYQDDLIEQIDIEGVKNFEENGSEVLEYTSEDLEPFKEVFMQIEDELVEKANIDKDIVEKIESTIN